MKKLFLIPALVIAAAVALAACGGGGGGNATAASGTGMNATSGSGMNAISTKDVGGTGTVLVDSSGQALYASDQETATGKVMCTGACNSFWVPVTVSGKTVSGSSAVSSKLGTVQRPDGGMQATYNGAPLYTFTQDQPGQVTGDGFRDAFGGQQFTWHAVTVGNSGSTSGGTSGGGGGGSTSSSGGGSVYSY